MVSNLQGSFAPTFFTQMDMQPMKASINSLGVIALHHLLFLVMSQLHHDAIVTADWGRLHLHLHFLVVISLSRVQVAPPMNVDEPHSHYTVAAAPPIVAAAL